MHKAMSLRWMMLKPILLCAVSVCLLSVPRHKVKPQGLGLKWSQHCGLFVPISMAIRDEESWMDRWLAWLKLCVRAYQSISHKCRHRYSVHFLQSPFPLLSCIGSNLYKYTPACKHSQCCLYTFVYERNAS